MKSIYALVAGTLLLSACAENELPKFNDADAFAAFTSSSMSVNENVASGELQIPVLFTSLAGLEKSVDFEIVDGTAAQGVDFEIANSSNTLNFTKDAPTQYITVKVKDNAEFGGDIAFTINLVETEGTNLGDSKTCEVKIVDDEHPLAFILGAYTGSAESYYNGPTTWSLTIEKDPDDVSKVWIYPMVPSGSLVAIYGVVNDAKTEIRIPVCQSLGVHSSYGDITLECYDETGDIYLEKGENVIGSIDANGNITIKNWMSAHVEAGWFEILTSPIVLTKQ